ncbi:MAG: methyl-accepting chemotaxis protein [Candidatus Azotimanducaceae bacterium]|jgi:methyl-accepting chemotaxis protein
MFNTNSIDLKWKVVFGVTLTSVLSVLLAVGIFAAIELQRLEGAVIKESSTIAEIIGGNTAGALSFSDTESGLEILQTLAAVPHIHEVIIFDDSDDPFVWYQWTGKENDAVKSGTLDDLPSYFLKSAPVEKVTSLDGEFSVVQKIMSEGSHIGTIYVLTDLKILDDTTSTYIMVTLLIVSGVTLFSLVLAMLIQRNIVAPINEVVSAIKNIAEGEGDLTVRLKSNTHDEIGELVTWFNTFVEKVQQIIIQFRDTANELSTAATELNTQSSETNQLIIGQQSEIETVLKAMTEMSTVVQDVADSAEESATDAEKADAESNIGRQIVGETMTSIEALASDIEAASEVISKLQQDSDSIGTVLDVIRGIAEQTNLLALNAAIEAARAGEQGRGFAVVADEVRTLASRTQESTQEIHDMIERLQSGSREAVTVMDKGRVQAHESVENAGNAHQSLATITTAVGTIKDASQQIAKASSEQRIMTKDINGNIVNISGAVRKTSNGSREMTSKAEELDKLSDDMLSLVGQFRI